VVGLDLIGKRRGLASLVKGIAGDPTSRSQLDSDIRAVVSRLLEKSAYPASPAFGLTWPLVTKADGTKFGKTETGAIWLTANRHGETSPNRTSAYQFYQFWLNTADADVSRFLRTFTLLPLEHIAALEAAHSTDPGKREAHRALAQHMTSLLHGDEALKQAEAAASALFSGDIAHLPADMLEEVLAAAPSSTHPRAQLEGTGLPLLDLLAQTTLAKSKTEARQFLESGSISVNGHKAAADARVSLATLLHGRVIALRRGKKSWHVTRWE
jgi:tyrosyl-tRNA synthetase